MLINPRQAEIDMIRDYIVLHSRDNAYILDNQYAVNCRKLSIFLILLRESKCI